MRVTISLAPVLLLLLLGISYAQDSESDEEMTVEDVTEDIDEKKDSIEVPYKTPTPIGNVYLAEHFDDRADYNKRWIISETKKEGAEDKIAKFDGKWELEEPVSNPLKGDLGLVLKSKAHHHAISTRLDRPFSFDKKPFILQYEVRFQNGQECGGAYLKLISQTPSLDLTNFNDKTPYSIMFGPDKCGNDNKLHFIFRHRNPKNGSFTEKHWKKSNIVPKFDDVFKDKKPHLFTLVMTPDNKFEVLIDKKTIQKGSLLEEFTPSVNPAAEIDDPNDKKPDDWDEREKVPDPSAIKPANWDEDAPRQIPDPSARKPDGWLEDEPELIPDPHADKPKDWDDEMDGEWEAPLINNPKCEKAGCGEWKPNMVDNPSYRGKWKASLVENPNFKGKWKPRRIVNPDHFEDQHPFRLNAIGAVGLELWSMSENILFDNIIITDDITVADQWAAETWALKKELADRETDNYLVQLIKYTNKYPWLWAVYIVAIALPVVLFISFCCVSSPQEKTSEATKRKKTDEYFPDDEPVEPSSSKSSLNASSTPVQEANINSDSGSSVKLQKSADSPEVSYSETAKEEMVEDDDKDEEEVEEEEEEEEEEHVETEEEEEVEEEDKDEDDVEKDASGEPKRSSPRQRRRARRE